MRKDRIPFQEQIAQQIIKRLQDGTAPWIKPWKPGEWQEPHNPISKNRYRGINNIILGMQDYQDSRWMTYNQAKDNGWQVRKGEKSTTIQYWKFSETKNKLDEKNNPVLGEDGKPVKVTYKLDRPLVLYAKVFNAEQIDGIPPLEAKPITWDAHEKAEAIIANSGASIHHDQADKAFYRSSTDNIHMPDRSSFDSSDAYYATLLHELGHWTGHESRLDRPLGNPFGSEAYAKEELRAEISSFMFNTELGLGHDPDQHVAYIGSWIRVLKKDSNEIFRAASDAEKIRDYIIGLQQEQTLEVEQNQSLDIAASYLARFHDHQLTNEDKSNINSDIYNGDAPIVAAMNLAKKKSLPLSDEGLIFKSTEITGIYKSPSIPGIYSLHLGSPNSANPEAARYGLIKEGKESFYTEVDFKNYQATLVGVQGLRQGGEAPAKTRNASVLAYKEFLRSLDESYLSSSGLDRVIQAHDKGDRLIQSIDSELMAEFQNYHRISVEGYSILETVNNLNQTAEAANLKFTVERNDSTEEFAAPYIVSYQFLDGTATGITGELHQDGKSASEVDGQRISGTGLTSDTVWQREALERAITEVLYRQQDNSVSLPEEAPQRGLEGQHMTQARADKTYIDVPYAEKNEAKALGAKWDRGAKSWYLDSAADPATFEKWPAKAVDLDSSKVYLAVPYKEKAEAKKLGAKWDKGAKSWYVPSSVDTSLVAKWMPVAAADRPALLPAEEFRGALTAHGFIFKNGELPEMDGKMHRVRVEGDSPGQTSGAYVGFLDGKPAGFFENHRSSTKKNWKSTGTTLTPEQRLALAAESEKKRLVREAQREATYGHHARRCQQLWSQLRPADNNEYLMAKGVDQYDVRQDKKGRLVVPLRDENGNIWSIQRISGNSLKSMKKGAKKSGSFHTLNAHALNGSNVILVAEGYSTAATLAKATNLPTVAAIDAGNLPKVALALKAKHPGKDIVICGDDDRFNKQGNKGREKAEEAAQLVGTVALFPRFISEKKLTDWNDLYQDTGLDSVKSQLAGPLGRLNAKHTLARQEAHKTRVASKVTKSASI